MNNESYLHRYTAEYKMAEEDITEYFEGINREIFPSLQVLCLLKLAKDNHWSVEKMLNYQESSDDPKESVWWQELEKLLVYLEYRFSIKFPQMPDTEEVEAEDGTTKISMYWNFEGTAELLSEVVSAILAGDEIPSYCFTNRFEFDPVRKKLWSSTLQEITRDCLFQMPVASFYRGYTILKSLEGEYGRILLSDAISFQYTIRKMESDEILIQFSSIDELLAAGWALD